MVINYVGRLVMRMTVSYLRKHFK